MLTTAPPDPGSSRAIHVSALATVCIVWALAGLLLQHGRDTALDGVRHSVARAASGTETSLNRLLVGMDALLADVATWTRDMPAPGAAQAQASDNSPALPTADTLGRLLRTAINQNLLLRDLYVTDASGQVLASARTDTRHLGVPDHLQLRDNTLKQLFPTLVISPPSVPNELSPERVIYLSRSAILGNGLPALVVAEIRVTLLSAELDPRDASGLTAITLESDDGLLMAAYPNWETSAHRTLTPALGSLASTQETTVTTAARTGSGEAILAVRQLLYGDLWVSASQSTQPALANWRSERQAIVGVASVLTLLLAGMWLGALRHVQRLAGARAEVARANEQLQASNQDLGHSLSLVRATLEATADAVLVVNDQARVTQFNARYAQVVGLSHGELTGCDAAHLRQHLCQLLKNPDEATQTALTAYQHPHSETRDELHFKDGRVYLRHSTPQLLNGQPTGRVWSYQDITAFRTVEQQLLAQQAQLNLARNNLAATLEALPDLLFELDENGTYLDAHAHSPDKMVVPPSRFLGKRVADVVPAKEAAVVMACLQEAKAKGSAYGQQVQLTIRGQPLWFELSAARKTTAPGEPLRFVMLARDVTERKASEALIWAQAHFDPLTGLPNRRMFRQHLQEALSPTRTSQGMTTKVALMFIDLDRFKEVNDAHGHDMGDQLLLAAAQRLRSCVRDSDLVARLGGDEFTLVIHDLDSEQQAQDIAHKVLARMAEPFDLGPDTEHISASVGVTLYPDDGLAWEDLIQQADQAMYAAKNAGRNRWERFSPAMQEAALVRARIARDLRGALAGNQLALAFQPVVDLRTGELHKAEALLRWHHPLQHQISPAVFIPIAEDTGQINAIGRWVLEQALQQLVRWRQTLHPEFQISVNISPAQLREGCADSQAWPELLTRLGLPGHAVVLEITEGMLMEASPGTRAQLARLHLAGMQVALDDFGTGYSAMSYLHQFDLDYLKIDRAFVKNLGASSKDLALCKATIVMAHELGLKVVAEGIETAEQQRLLTEAGCDFGQGYLFAKPLPAREFEAWARAQGHTPPRNQPDRRQTGV